MNKQSFRVNVNVIPGQLAKRDRYIANSEQRWQKRALLTIVSSLTTNNYLCEADTNGTDDRTIARGGIRTFD